MKGPLVCLGVFGEPMSGECPVCSQPVVLRELRYYMRRSGEKRFGRAMVVVADPHRAFCGRLCCAIAPHHNLKPSALHTGEDCRACGMDVQPPTKKGASS